jgi:aspartyl-tRNA(Asn)/glutamyl-tRNA(Gln) amidotransferase subunit A
MARSVEACALADAVISGEEHRGLEPEPLRGLRFGIPQGFPLRDLDQIVGVQFAQAVTEISRNGVQLSDQQLPLFDDMTRINSVASIAQVEAYAAHKFRLATRGADYDPNVRVRIEAGRAVPGADYASAIRERQALVRAMDSRLAELDVLLLPTTPIVAPTMAEVSTPEAFAVRNRLLLRNTAFANFFDLCAVSLPLPPAGGLATGLMLVARNGQDRRLLRIAAAIEPLIGR